MQTKNRHEVQKWINNQKAQLGLDDSEVQALMDQTMPSEEEADEDLPVLAAGLDLEVDAAEEAFEYEQMPQQPMAAKARRAPAPSIKRERKKAKRKDMSDPYLPQSQTIKARPTRISKIRSFLYEFALPNEYIVQIGVKDAVPVLGGKFLKLGKRFLKFPAAVQTVYFTSDNANKNYQGLMIDGYACWRVDPEKPDVAARNLDFSDQNNPMGNTNRILQTICTEAIRHLIANITIEEALTKKDEIGRDLKAQLERIERSWGVTFDQVGIERVTILSARVFEDLQQKSRDLLRLAAFESKVESDREIEKKRADYEEEMDRLQRRSEKEARILRATSESEIHSVEIDEQSKREAEQRTAEEERGKAQAEAAERAAVEQAERTKRQASRDFEIEAHKDEENRKLEVSRVAAEAEIKINAAEVETKVFESRVQSEQLQAEAEHTKQLTIQKLEAEQAARIMETEHQQAAERQAAELARTTAEFEHTVKLRRETIKVDHEAESKRLERKRIEEELHNLISENRLLAGFVEKLPEIASSINIDRYTVLDGSGSSPMAHTLSQLLSILDEHGLKKYLTRSDRNEKKEKKHAPQK